MQLRREEWRNLNPDDVAWVTEWQLAARFPWIPMVGGTPVIAEPEPDDDGARWTVHVRAGRGMISAKLPLRDLAFVINWCRSLARPTDLERPSARLRASLRALRASLNCRLSQFDPLDTMGYAETPNREGTES